MKLSVLNIRQKLKILYAVVRPVAVFVVNMLGESKPPPEMAFHHYAMLSTTCIWPC